MSENTNNGAPGAIDPKEFAVAEAEAKKSTDAYTHKFKRPFAYEGRTYDELTFDWDKCTGKDALDIEYECQALGKTVIVPTLSGEYLIRFAAKACTEKIGADALMLMSIKDYNVIRSQARSFLLSTELFMPTVAIGSDAKP